MPKPKNTHGGKRPGSGSKPLGARPKVPMTIKIDATIKDYLSTTESQIDTIEAAVKRSKGFRDWINSQPN